MTAAELERIITELRHRVNQQSAQIAALEGLISTMAIDEPAFSKARIAAFRWKRPVIEGPRGGMNIPTPDLDTESYLNRIEEAVASKP